MPVQEINISDILVEKSRFSLSDICFESDHPDGPFEESLRNSGILLPVVVHRDRKGQLHLVDGRQRIHFARKNQLREISAVVLTEEMPVADILLYMLCNNRGPLEQSAINKVQFICFAVSLGAEESWILNSLCTPFGFKPYGEFLMDCRRINGLPESVKLFCHEKKFSLKQILNLAHYPEEILLQLMEWRADIQITASILDEIASHLRDHLKAHKKTLSDFLSESGAQEIIKSSMSPRDKTEKLREIIRLRRFPVLSEVNKNMEETVEQLKLPSEISVAWDKTLENKNVDIVVHLYDMKKFEGLLKILNSLEMKEAAGRMLDKL